MISWNLQKRKIKDIFPNEKNPRKMSKRQAKELGISLRKFGLCEPIVLNTTGKVLGGHQRLKLLRSFGHADVDVYVPNQPLTEAEEDELTIRLNKNVGFWDDDSLANHWSCEMLLNAGFNMEELQIESVPDQKNAPTKFTIIINCISELQLEILETYVSALMTEHAGASYRAKIR